MTNIIRIDLVEVEQFAEVVAKFQQQGLAFSAKANGQYWEITNIITTMMKDPTLVAKVAVLHKALTQGTNMTNIIRIDLVEVEQFAEVVAKFQQQGLAFSAKANGQYWEITITGH